MPAHKKQKELVKRPVSVALPRYILVYLDKHNLSRSEMIHTALVSHYRIKVPDP